MSDTLRAAEAMDEKLKRAKPAAPTRSEATEAFDALVDQARELIAEVGENRARAQLEQGLLEALQDDRDRAETVVAMAVEGAIRQARRNLRMERSRATAAQPEGKPRRPRG
ncbi:hypothetical protein [Nocardiopsis sp. FR26]|uniref:hypothetical protein n=1 Tax=Nocardiopsis sp. FR26 TaxID=2605987 RepID=UPI00135A1A51|nr:hypothetical protein [Nocardiopsis sp. FR26]